MDDIEKLKKTCNELIAKLEEKLEHLRKIEPKLYKGGTMTLTTSNHKHFKQYIREHTNLLKIQKELRDKQAKLVREIRKKFRM
jgi:hypothetical protein